MESHKTSALNSPEQGRLELGIRFCRIRPDLRKFVGLIQLHLSLGRVPRQMREQKVRVADESQRIPTPVSLVIIYLYVKINYRNRIQKQKSVTVNFGDGTQVFEASA